MAEEIFPALGREGLTQAVERAIRRAILERRLSPGERIVEARLSEALGVSRAPIREALARLEEQGLVVSRIHRGTFVVRLGPHDIREILALRALLEGYAAGCAATRCDPHDLAYLEQLAGAAHDAAIVGNWEATVDRDVEFSARLLEIAGMPRLRRLWSGVVDPLRLLVPNLRRWTGPVLPLTETYSAVLEALRRHDPDGARRAVEAHLEAWEPLWIKAGSHGS